MEYQLTAWFPRWWRTQSGERINDMIVGVGLLYIEHQLLGAGTYSGWNDHAGGDS